MRSGGWRNWILIFGLMGLGASATLPTEYPKLRLKKFLIDQTQRERIYFEARRHRNEHRGEHIYLAAQPGVSIVAWYEGKTKPFRYLGCKQRIAEAFEPCFGQADFMKNYENEVLVWSDGEKIWIPMPKTQFGSFVKGVKKGEKVVLQLRYWGHLIGATKKDDSLLLFAVGYGE